MKTREELKSRIMKKVEIKIDELLDWKEEVEAPTLLEIEKIVLKVRQEISEEMTQTIIQEQKSVRIVPGPSCQSCEQEMHYKGMKKKDNRLCGRGRDRERLLLL